MFSNNDCWIVEFDFYLRERTVLILWSFIKKKSNVSKILFPYFFSIFVQNNKKKNEIEYENKFWKVEFDSCFYI
jgi:hypothetical protein